MHFRLFFLFITFRRNTVGTDIHPFHPSFPSPIARPPPSVSWDSTKPILETLSRSLACSLQTNRYLFLSLLSLSPRSLSPSFNQSSFVSLPFLACVCVGFSPILIKGHKQKGCIFWFRVVIVLFFWLAEAAAALRRKNLELPRSPPPECVCCGAPARSHDPFREGKKKPPHNHRNNGRPFCIPFDFTID